jgi:ParB family chromosome partitioning protein
MEDTKKRLGRGLSALLGDLETKPVATESLRDVRKIAIESLAPNPFNPRTSFPDDALEELAESIRRHGVISPILVRQVGDRYEIIAGERRWRAAQRAGLHEVPIISRTVTEGEALELAIIENVQRSDLNPIEEAQGYQRLIDEFGHKQEVLAKLIGKSRSHVANTLRLLNLPASIRACVAAGDLSAGHARALIGVPNAEAIADQVIRQGLSVRATEALVASLGKDRGEPRAPRRVDDANTRALVKRLSDRLGLAVAINHNADESGQLMIKYTSLEQLEEVCRLLGET